MAKEQIKPLVVKILRNDLRSNEGARKGNYGMLVLPEGENKRPVGDTIQYQCQKCGECCRKGFSIELSLDEMNFFAKKHPEMKMIYAYREGDYVHPFFNTGPGCNLLEGNECSVYKNRPFECRYFPFHLEEVNASTPGSYKFGKKHYLLFVYENCKGIGKGEPWSPRKMKSFVSKMLREYAEHYGMLKVTYKKLTTEKFLKNRKHYGTGVIYGTDEEIEEFIRDYRSKFDEEE
jgi:Fe-S-cluster containining protein